MPQQMLILKACTLHRYVNKFCLEKQKCKITAEGLSSVSPSIYENLTGFQDTLIFFSISALSTCCSVLQERGWAFPEQEGDLCQAAGGQLLCSLAAWLFLLSLLFSPRMPRTMEGLGRGGMQFWSTQSERCRLQTAKAQHRAWMWHGLGHGGGDLWEEV